MSDFALEEQREEDTQRGRFLTFTLADNAYALPIRAVTEIVGVQQATKVPETPDYVKGITNLRGRIIPLIDMRLKFGKEEISYGERTCVIIIDVDSVAVGLVVDRVDDVLTIGDSQIAPTPPDGALGFENRYIDGIAKTDAAVLLLLNAEKLLKTDEMALVESLAAENA